MRNFKTESVSNLVALGFVYLDERGFLGLIGNWLSRTDARPVENVQVVKAAFGLEQLPALHGSFAGQLRGLSKKLHLGSVLPQINHFTEVNQLMLVYGVKNVHPVGIIRAALDARLYFHVEIPAIQIIGRNAVAIFRQPPRRHGFTGP